MRSKLEILQKICDWKGEESDLNRLEKLANNIKNASVCGLGQTAPNPVLSTIHYFRDEYEEHIKNKNCPAGQCKALLKMKINPEKCKRCGLCAKNCPVGAITGSREEGYTIDTDKCIKCGLCQRNCHFGAI